MIKENRLKTPKYWLTLKDCRNIFAQFHNLISFNQPFPPFNNRYKGILEGILGSVKQTFAGKYLNKNVIEAGAALFNQLIRGHPFINGNKRLAVIYLYVFLYTNNVEISISFEGMYNLALLLALVSERGISAEETKKIITKLLDKHTHNRKSS